MSEEEGSEEVLLLLLKELVVLLLLLGLLGRVLSVLLLTVTQQVKKVTHRAHPSFPFRVSLVLSWTSALDTVTFPVHRRWGTVGPV